MNRKRLLRVFRNCGCWHKKRNLSLMLFYPVLGCVCSIHLTILEISTVCTPLFLHARSSWCNYRAHILLEYK